MVEEMMRSTTVAYGPKSSSENVMISSSTVMFAKETLPDMAARALFNIPSGVTETYSPQSVFIGGLLSASAILDFPG